MAKINSFEDIKAWQKARELNIFIYNISNKNKNFNSDFGLRDQIRRASISISSNIAEGFERQTNKEFIRYLFMAKASAGEVRSQLYLASDLNYVDNIEFNELNEKIKELSKMISGFITYLTTISNNETKNFSTL